jgi:hypothetical protein
VLEPAVSRRWLKTAHDRRSRNLIKFAHVPSGHPGVVLCSTGLEEPSNVPYSSLQCTLTTCVSACELHGWCHLSHRGARQMPEYCRPRARQVGATALWEMAQKPAMHV